MNDTDQTVRIAIISPGKRQGCTTLSVLLGLAFARTQNMSTCLLHAGDDNGSTLAFLGEMVERDNTKSLEVLLELVNAASISLEEVKEYARCLAEDLYLLETQAPEIELEESNQLLVKLLGVLDYNVIITDINTDLYEDVTQEIINASDIVIVVVEQATDMLRSLERWVNTPDYESIDSKGEIFIVNRFNKNVSSLADFLKGTKIDTRYCYRLTDASKVKSLSNTGRLYTIFRNILNKDLTLLEINFDLLEIMKAICMGIGIKFRNWNTPKKSEVQTEKSATHSRSGRSKSK